MTTKLERSVEKSLAAAKSTLRTSLAHLESTAESRLRSLVRVLKRHPGPGLGAAFVAGWVLARVLTKLD